MPPEPSTPKRRRGAASTPPLSTKTSLSADLSPPNKQEGGSPRTAVANRLSDLNLSVHNVTRIPYLETENTTGERVRVCAGDRDDTIEGEEDGFLSIRRNVSMLPHQQRSVSITNTTPTTTPVKKRARSPPPEIDFPDPPAISDILTPPVHSRPKAAPRRTRSPPSITTQPSSLPSAAPKMLAETSFSDLSDPDDDGYGINGIGYRPTPAMAYARQQKRKQQVLEWRAREAKDARQKRRERRLGGEDADASGGGAMEGERDGARAVRFA